MKTLFLLTLAGLTIGLMGDVAAGGRDLLSADNICAAILFAPLLAIVGGGVVSKLFLIGGVLFWPIWSFLACRWTTDRNPVAGALIVAWSGQGFFQLIHRLGLVMSA
jgi:hypothetical protein